MHTRLIIVLLACCTACQSGRIPCPAPDVVRAKKVKVSNTTSTALTARALPENEETGSRSGRAYKLSEVKTISNVSVEEWDCPRQGKRKYLPKEVKENIRRNMKQIKADKIKENKADTLSYSPEK